MDQNQKTWLWRKRSSEKTIIANGKDGFDMKGKVEEAFLPNEKEAALEESVKILNEKIASLTSECNVKEELLKDYAERARQAAAGKEKAEKGILHLKKELDEALQQKFAANDRLGNLNAALKDCMQHLSSVRDEKERSVHDAIVRTSEEFEKAHKKLEEKLAETGKKLASLTAENSHLYKALQLKEKLIEDLSDQRSQIEAEFNALMARMDSVEKENAFLRYEFRILEKDLDIRNEEIEFTRRSAEASEKHYLQNLNKIKKLEAECQRLRVLVRKRLPAPALLSNMRAEVEIQERSQMETRRRRMNSVTGGLIVRESTRENLDISSKRISFLVERLQNVEQENKTLRELLTKIHNDVSHSPVPHTQIAPISSQGGAQLGEHHIVEQSMELAVSGVNTREEYETSSSRSWDSTLISGLENLRDGNLKKTSEHKVLGIADMSLMDDFVEMEKLAIVALDVPHGNAFAPSDMHQTMHDSLKKENCHSQADSTCMELVPVGKELSETPEHLLQLEDTSARNPCYWLQEVLKIIMEQVDVSRKSIDELLKDIKNAFQAEIYESGSSTHSGTELLPVSGFITWKSPSVQPSNGVPDGCSLFCETNHALILPVSTSINKIIELVRSLYSGHSKGCSEPDNLLKRDIDDSLTNKLATAEDYAFHVFGWKACDLAEVLQRFICTCNYLLDGTDNFEKFAAELSLALEWIMNQCITKQGFGSRYDLKQHFCQTAFRTAAELGPSQNLLLEMEKIQSILELENKGLKSELSSLKCLQKNLELSLQSAREKSEVLSSHLEQSQRSITNLQIKLATLSESKTMIEDQFENQKMLNEELDTQLNVAKVRLNDISQKLSSLEVELEDKSQCCEELEGTCLELKLQLESIAGKHILKDDSKQDQNLLQTGWEVKAASLKLAECEATILNLGNQLKALTQPNEACKVLSNPGKNNKKLKQHLSLMDRMLSEDGSKPSQIKELPTMETHEQSSFPRSGAQVESSGGGLVLKNSASKASNAGALVVFSGNKRGRGIGFVKRLLLWKKRGSNKKTPFSFAN